MDILITILIMYGSAGLGFTISAWLQAAETARMKKTVAPSIWRNPIWFLAFSLGWIFVAIYCYRAEVRRTIPDIEYQIDMRHK